MKDKGKRKKHIVRVVASCCFPTINLLSLLVTCRFFLIPSDSPAFGRKDWLGIYPQFPSAHRAIDLAHKMVQV